VLLLSVQSVSAVMLFLGREEGEATFQSNLLPPAYVFLELIGTSKTSVHNLSSGRNTPVCRSLFYTAEKISNSKKIICPMATVLTFSLKEFHTPIRNQYT